MTNHRDVGRFLEAQTKTGQTITYAQLRDNFPDLPPITAAWLSHPLCEMFGQLDHEDAAAGKPFRTTLVIRGTGKSRIPGSGFFKMLAKLRGITILRSEREAVWKKELNDLLSKHRSLDALSSRSRI